MITLDASLVIAHLNPHDDHHRPATDYLRDVEDEPLLIHSLSLAEILVGGARVGREQQMLDDLHSIGVVVADSTEGEPMRLARLRVETGLKLPDCCALDTARSTGSVLATFDQALAGAARSRHVTVAPDHARRASGSPG